jgi:hypothetical protein
MDITVDAPPPDDVAARVKIVVNECARQQAALALGPTPSVTRWADAGPIMTGIAAAIDVGLRLVEVPPHADVVKVLRKVCKRALSRVRTAIANRGAALQLIALVGDAAKEAMEALALSASLAVQSLQSLDDHLRCLAEEIQSASVLVGNFCGQRFLQSVLRAPGDAARLLSSAAAVPRDRRCVARGGAHDARGCARHLRASQRPCRARRA